jgi:hypothetical protein
LWIHIPTRITPINQDFTIIFFYVAIAIHTELKKRKKEKYFEKKTKYHPERELLGNDHFSNSCALGIEGITLIFCNSMNLLISITVITRARRRMLCLQGYVYI